MTENYEEYLDNKDNKSNFSFKIFDRAKPMHVILFAILLFIGDKIVKSNGSTWVYVTLGGLGVLYLFSVMKQEDNKKPIPRYLAQEIARNDLLKEISFGRVYILGTKVIPTSYFRDQSWDSGDGPKLFKYNIGFEIREPHCGLREIIYQMNPYTGECKGIVEAPTGFNGQDLKDIQMIFPEKIIKEEKSS